MLGKYSTTELHIQLDSKLKNNKKKQYMLVLADINQEENVLFCPIP